MEKKITEDKYKKDFLSSIEIEELYNSDKKAMQIAEDKLVNSLNDEQKALYKEYCGKRENFYLTASVLYKKTY